MARLSSYQVVEAIVVSLGNDGRLDPERQPEVAEGIALVTITMRDGSRFNVQVRKIQSEEDKTERIIAPQSKLEFGKKKIRVKRTDETPEASSG